MSNLSWFVSESDVVVDDRAFYERLCQLRKKNDWAALVCDWYEDPRKKDYQARSLKVPKAKNADGFPRFTFSVLDGCQVHGYWDTRGGKQLQQVLSLMGAFLGKPPKKAARGLAEFKEDGGDVFALVVDYQRATVAACYQQWIWLEFGAARK